MYTYFIIVLLINYVCSKKNYYIDDSPICRKQNSCSYMFGKEYDLDFCKKIQNTGNHISCEAAYNDTIINKHKNLGKLTLFPIYGDERPIFNVTFSDIKFKMLRIYFQGQYYQEGQSNCSVTEFVLNGSLLPDQSFSYVCPWTGSSVEQRVVEFNFDYGIEQYETRKKYIFKAPNNMDLKEEYVTAFFPYVDITDLRNIVLHIHPAKNKLNDTKYKVDFIHTYDNQSSLKSSVILTAENNSCSFYPSDAGEYYFQIEPLSSYCLTNKNACDVQITPEIRIESTSTTLLIGMVGVSLLIPIFMIIVYMWTKHWPGLLKPKPNILLVTVPTNDAHVIVAPAFAEFLHETLNVNVMLDINETPQNSFDWLKVAIHNYVSHIVYLRSDDELNSNKVIHQDIYLQTLRLLDPKLNPKSIKECIISFPYSSSTSENSHPELAHIIKKFHFKFNGQLRKLNNFIVKRKKPVRDVNNSTYKKLLEAIQEVERERSVRKNQRNIDVRVLVPNDNDDGFSGQCKNKENVDVEQVKVDLDISEFCLLGEQQVSNNDQRDSDDSDLDDFNLLGDV